MLKLILGVLLSLSPLEAGRAGQVWSVTPAYETPASVATSLSISDDAGVSRPLYPESHAILILEGAYRDSAFERVDGQAVTAEQLLRGRLEDRHFHVLVWRDLTGEQLKETLDEVFSTYGHHPQARVFFYYFGHGKMIAGMTPEAGAQSYLVPIDAPDPLKDLAGFYRTAVPLQMLVSYASQSNEARHLFFALEACQAGSIASYLYHLGGPDKPNPKAYLLSDGILTPIRQFLAAGDPVKLIPADNSFTALLAAGLSSGDADTNHDGYITGTELIAFIRTTLPQFAKGYYNNLPESGNMPADSQGDFVFGPVDPTHPAPIASAASSAATADLMTLSHDQLRALVKERLTEFANFTTRYWEEISQVARVQDALAATLPSPGSTAPPNMSVPLAIAWKMTLEEKGVSEFNLRYLPDLLRLRAELLRRGAWLPSDPQIVKVSTAASHSLEAGGVPDKDGVAALTQYFNRLADSLI